MKHMLLGRPLNPEEMSATYCVWDPGKETLLLRSLVSYLVKGGWIVIPATSEFIWGLNEIVEAKVIYELENAIQLLDAVMITAILFCSAVKNGANFHEAFIL